VNATVLIVDDEPVFRVLAEEALVSEGFEVRVAETLKKARAEIDRATPDVVILDRRLPDGDGIDFLKTVRPDDSSATVAIVVTAYGDVENAVEALKAGASDYLTKPIQLTDLIVKLRKVLENRGLRDRLAIARSSAAGPPMVEPRSAVMRAVVERLSSVSRSPLTPVFMYGPSGVGKQRIAELLHTLTWSKGDPNAPFLEINCAALPEDLVESELFGHEKGAFTDAKAMRRGLFEMSAGGTLFLDEITELPQRSQAKLLKFLDTMRFRRVGGEREIAVELRVVAATNQDVQSLVRAGKFREDLFHRLAVFVLTIPPLVSRPEDIPDLAELFIRFIAGRVKKKVSGLTPRALAALRAYNYPGNVRELRNIIERAVILAEGPQVTDRDLILPARAAAAGGPDAFFSMPAGAQGDPPKLDDVERAYVAHVLEYCEGRRMAAAQALGISYPTFLKRLRELGLE
jgi:two-component system, NtrC family, response regulator AtoC